MIKVINNTNYILCENSNNKYELYCSGITSGGVFWTTSCSTPYVVNPDYQICDFDKLGIDCYTIIVDSVQIGILDVIYGSEHIYFLCDDNCIYKTRKKDMLCIYRSKDIIENATCVLKNYGIAIDKILLKKKILLIKDVDGQVYKSRNKHGIFTKPLKLKLENSEYAISITIDDFSNILVLTNECKIYKFYYMTSIPDRIYNCSSEITQIIYICGDLIIVANDLIYRQNNTFYINTNELELICKIAIKNLYIGKDHLIALDYDNKMYVYGSNKNEQCMTGGKKCEFFFPVKFFDNKTIVEAKNRF